MKDHEPVLGSEELGSFPVLERYNPRTDIKREIDTAVRNVISIDRYLRRSRIERLLGDD